MRAAGHIVQRRGDLSRERLIIDSECRCKLACSPSPEQGSSDPWRIPYP